ncbi:UNKNOWN [Stylonychia lemnae]|uniref:TLDc domain-containing protein n=1 Tax=Stylonychia lemnae TaxID=5949 RepID=A0A078AMC0_STYLE|nr:UNKNOWN [Stylonychia lemnae]|eukprot:CDW83051.1 UNKNOWN [Stylonychia lemnae]
MLCSRCIQIQPHPHFSQDQKKHFTFERKFLDESFGQMIPILKDEMNQIQILMDNMHQFLNKERNFNVSEIQQMIDKNCHILQKSSLDDKIKSIFKDQDSFKQAFQINQEQLHVPHKQELEEEKQQVIDQNQEEIKVQEHIGQNPLSLLSQQINKIESRDQLEIDTLQKIGEQDQQKYIQFRGLVDNVLSGNAKENVLYDKLFKVGTKNKLVYKGTRDGFRPAFFHIACDNKGPTITLILSDKGEVFGGYSSLSWESSNQWVKDPHAFIFSLTKNTLHEQYQHFEQGVLHHSLCFMRFGYGNDIFIKDNCNINCNSYCLLGGTFTPPQGSNYGDQLARDYLAGCENFRVIEIEVYTIAPTNSS